MDPFTEKLLERTRARRENLQKKMADRPKAANRQMVKRPREPLADTNSVISEPLINQVIQGSSKLSPSKRRCSGENIQPLGDENQKLDVSQSIASVLSDPPTDKKPPVGPTSVRSSSSLDKTTLPAVQFQPAQLKTVQPESERMQVIFTPDVLSTREAEVAPSRPALYRNNEDPLPSAAGMKSRLQKLAEQRKYWDGDGNSDADPDATSLSLLKRQTEVPPAAAATAPSETPLGRKGRLANLAATIGSWEDDVGPASISKQNTTEKAGTAVSKFAVGGSTVSATSKADAVGRPVVISAASSKSIPSSNQHAVYSSVKSSTVLPQSPQKADIPATKSACQSGASPQKSFIQGMTSSPQKTSIRGTVFPSSPQKAGPSASALQNPQENRVLSGDVRLTASPQKPELCAKLAINGSSVFHEKACAGAPASVKSFLECFEERCQKQTNQNGPAGVAAKAKGPSVTPSVTPNTRRVQNRLGAAQLTNTAELAQRQKLERESELAQIRKCFQKGTSVWNKTDEAAEAKKCSDMKLECVQSEVAPSEPQCEPETPSAAAATEGTRAPTRTPPENKPVLERGKRCEICSCEAGDTPEGDGKKHTVVAYQTIESHVLVVSPAASTSSPQKVAICIAENQGGCTSEKQEVVTETDVNMDQSINSAVINELFDGVLEQSEDEEDEEENALNISSMSLLIPLVETVTPVVKNPEKRMMTSTPHNSFIVKSSTADDASKAGRFQRANMVRTASSDSVEASDNEHRLPYSIDAYRSTRVKETERPNVKQVIVRKENVSNRAEEPRGSSLFSIKQKMKILTNEMNLQQTVIHQASQALNCCTDEEHGKGSQVEAEAERLLLVATEKREALKVELEHLKRDPKESKAPESSSTYASKGSITLQELSLPLKADFVCSTANKPESTKHSFFLMIRAGAENTVATPLASTHRGLSGDTLTFPTKFTLSDVSSDFEIDVEVYCLVQKREVCSDKKKKPSKSKIIWRWVHEAHDSCVTMNCVCQRPHLWAVRGVHGLQIIVAITPKRFLAITKSVQTPVVASPGGPNAVRTSNFVLVGSHKLTLASVGKNKFLLEKIRYEASEKELFSGMFHTKVPFLCPLEGHIYLKMQCDVGSKVEERGFLTMFEDVSGFGAWHRRWCVLSGYCISYWTYPDDEKRKNPIGRISLANCTSKSVEPANREFCARPNTFELITVRPRREDDRETLVSQCKNAMCVTKNWLSADTKDERNLWMKKLNQILVDLRMWQPGARSELL